MKTNFPPEGPLVSAMALGVDVAKPECTTRHPSRDKLKQVCSTLLHWEVDKFEEVEVIIKCYLCVYQSLYNFPQRNLYSA